MHCRHRLETIYKTNQSFQNNDKNISDLLAIFSRNNTSNDSTRIANLRRVHFQEYSMVRHILPYLSFLVIVSH